MRFLTFALMVALAVPLPFATPLAYAADVPATEDGKRKINLSGRQRMLSQRMAKAACFAAMGVETAAHLDQTLQSHALFDATLHALRHGDPAQGMNETKAPRVLEELDGVEELWISYGAAVETAAKSPKDAQAALSQIADLNLPVLLQMNKAVGEFERHYGGTGNIHPVLALALNVSGRQRMLSQKAAKEFCLILTARDVATHRDGLVQTVALFERSLVALMDGDDDMGLPPAPTDEIRAQLQIVKDLWTPLKAIFDATIAGAAPTDADIARIALDNNALLTEMNRAVWMYDQL